MTANTLEERRKYINKIRESFHNPEESSRYGNISGNSEKDQPAVSFGGVRIALAIILFAVFIFCDRNQIHIAGYSTQDIYQSLEQSISFEKVLQFGESMLEYAGENKQE